VPQNDNDIWRKLAGLVSASRDTYQTREDVQTVVDYYNAAKKVLDYVSSQTNTAPTDADYLRLGIEGMTTGLAGALNQLVIADQDIGELESTQVLDLITVKENIQTLVVNSQTQYAAVLEKFKDYADDPVNADVLTDADYQALGITLDAAAVTAVNTTIANVFGSNLNTSDDIQALVDDTIIDLGANNGQLLGAAGGTYVWSGVFATEVYVWDKNDDGQIDASDKVALNTFLTQFQSFDADQYQGVNYEPPKFTIDGVRLQMISENELKDSNSGGPVAGMTVAALPELWGDADLFHTGTTGNMGVYTTFKQVALADDAFSNPTSTTYNVNGTGYTPWGSNTPVTPPDAWIMLKVI
jgi:hypothetical protein